MTPPTEDPAITALNAILKPLGTKLGHYEAYAREPAIAAMRAVLEAESERCAQVVADYLDHPNLAGNELALHLIAEIATAIRNPTPPSGE